jgi:hypothetical protein
VGWTGRTGGRPKGSKDKKKRIFGNAYMSLEDLHGPDGPYDHAYEPAFQGKRKVCLECRRGIARRYRADLRALNPRVDPEAERMEKHFAAKGHYPNYREALPANRHCITCEKTRDRKRNKGVV